MTYAQDIDPLSPDADDFRRIVGPIKLDMLATDTNSAITVTRTGSRSGSFSRRIAEREGNAYVALGDLGAVSGSSTDQYNRLLDAIDIADSLGIGRIMIDGNYVVDHPVRLDKQVSLFGRGWSDRLRINTDNTAPGLHIASVSNISVRDFDLAVYSANDITNGTGHNGTCITTCDWFNNPLTLPENVAVKNILIDNMKLSRIEGGTGHALAFMARTRNVRVSNCFFQGASNNTPHGDAVLAHWGGWSNGVSTASLFYDNQGAAFVEGRTVVGGTSGARGIIVKDEVLGGGTGRLAIKEVVGTFLNNEPISCVEGGNALADGGTWVYELAYDGGSGIFSIGQTVTGTGGTPPTAVIAHITVLSGTTGVLHLSDQSTVSSTFTDNMAITTATGAALCNGVRLNTGLVQAPFLPGKYTFHPNGIYIKSCEMEYTQRLIAMSSCYDIHIDKFRVNDPNCVQLVDLPVGDEGETFAHPEDYGNVYSNFSFRDIHCPYSGGSGSNGVTVVDCSGFNTSKQLDSDLLAYGGIAYSGYRYNQAQDRIRQFYWYAVSLENFVWDAGPRDPASSTDYVRQIWLRNLIGDFSFKNMYTKGHDSPSDPDGVPLTLTIDNFRGIANFENVNMYGGVFLRDIDGVSIKNCKIAQPENEDALSITGDVTVVTTNATGFVASATSITLSAPLTSRFCIGTPVRYANGVCYVNKLANTGDTVIVVTSIPASQAGATSVTLDRSTRNVNIIDTKLTTGRRGVTITGPGMARVSGGSIRRMGQYGMLAEAEGVLLVDHVDFRGNGIDKYATPATGTRNLIAGVGGSIHARHCTFGESVMVNYNFLNSAGSGACSIEDCIFEDVPISGYAFLGQGEPFSWRNNYTGTGVPVELSTARRSANRQLPKLYIDGDSRAAQCSATGRTVSRSWLYPLQMLLSTRMDFQPSDNLGVAGDTSTQFLARVSALLGVEPGIVIAICSTNDRTGAGLTADETIANLLAWQTAVLAHGHKVIWLAETPRGSAEDGTYTMTTAQIRRHLRVRNWQLAQQAVPDVYVVDAWPTLSDVNSSTALANNGLFYDGLHFGPPGARLMADAIYATLEKMLPPRPRLVESLAALYNATDNVTGALNANPVLAGTGGTNGTNSSGTVATSWTTVGGAGLTVVCSKVTVAAINRQRLVITGTATAADSGATPVDPTPYSVVCSVPLDHTAMTAGSVIEASGYLSLAAGSSGVRGVAIYMSVTTAGGTTTYCCGEPHPATSSINLNYPNTAIEGAVVVPRATMPSGVTAATLSVVVTGQPNNTLPISATVEFTKVSARKVS